MSDLTKMFDRVSHVDPKAAEELVPLVYREVRQLAAQKLAREASAHTFQPTALVHEAWLRLRADAQPEWQNRAHFFAAAAEAMRRILVDSARRRLAGRWGAGISGWTWVKPAPAGGLGIWIDGYIGGLLYLPGARRRTGRTSTADRSGNNRI